MKKFTLIELLIVVAIIAILASLLFPSLGRMRYKAKIAVCASNMSQSGKGLAMYIKNNNGSLPDVQNHFGSAPYTTRVAYWNNTGKYYNLGQVWKGGYADGAVFYCPQNATNGQTKYTYDYNKKNGKFGLHSGDYYIRTSYHLMMDEMTTSQRRKLKMSQLSGDVAFLVEGIESTGNTAHTQGRTGWNLMKPDFSVKFVRSQQAWSLVQGGGFTWNWTKAENVIGKLFDDC